MGSLMSLERLMKSPIIQELRRWSGQNHELHRLQRTIIKGEEAALSKTTLFSQKRTLSQNRKSKSKDKKKKRSISCHSKAFFAKLHKKQSSPHDIHYITNPFKRFPSNLLHDTCFWGIILPLSHQIFLSLFSLSKFIFYFVLVYSLDVHNCYLP